MHDSTDRVLVTGANGHLGGRLLSRIERAMTLDSRGTPPERAFVARAFVRSPRAASSLRNDPALANVDIVVGDYTDRDDLVRAMQGCRFVVHLVGIIKESGGARYEQAHEATCRQIADAATAAGIERVVYLSILGSSPESSNACLASKGRAEAILLSGSVPATVLRVPMVMGEGDFAAMALKRQAMSSRTFLVAGGVTLQQPIDAEDVISAVLQALGQRDGQSIALDLAGPESLTHRELVARAAGVNDKPPPKIIKIPRSLAMGMARVMERVLTNPPITQTMLEILEHDDRINPDEACRRLSIELTPLDRTLARCVGPSSEESMQEDQAGAPDDSNGGATQVEAPGQPGIAARVLPWAITLACFYYLYGRLDAAAAREGTTLVPYLAAIFAGVDWGRWLALMIPYSIMYFLIDSAVAWRVINWFNAPVRYTHILPIRASSYILSIINEQVGKGAIAVYLNRTNGIPGWEVGSSMLFIMLCEFYYLLAWALVGWYFQGDVLPEVFGAIPIIAAVAFAVFPLLLAFFHGRLPFGQGLRERPILKAFREASWGQYLVIVLMRSPALLLAVVVYTLALQLFGIEDVTFGRMLGVLPVIFFGAATPGPMRTVAITLWVALFPGYEGQMTTFGFVQHNFFIFFNAAIGLLFLRRANRELRVGSADEGST